MNVCSAHRLRAGAIIGLLLATFGCARDELVTRYWGRLEGRDIAFDFAAAPGAARPVVESSRVDVGSTEALGSLVSGWGDPETDAATGTTFAWVTGEEASVEMILLRARSAELLFRCWPLALAGTPTQHVEVAANGVSLGGVDLARGAETYSIEIPAGALKPGRNRLQFVFDWSASPRDRGEGQSADARTLAAAFDEIWLEPAGVRPVTRTLARATVTEQQGLVLTPGCGLSYTLSASGDVVLDPGLGNGIDADGLLIWLKAPGGEPRWLLAPGTRPRPLRIRWPSGKPLSIGFAVAGGYGPGSTIALRPRLLAQGSTVRPAANLLLIVMDTLRADFVGSYGGRAATPSLDSLAERGTAFDRAYAHIAITGPSHASLFTSLLPFEHGVHNNARILGPSARTLAEILREAGWTTAAVVSLGVLKREFGFQQGFADYRDDFGGDWMKDAGEINSEAIPLLDTLTEPFFLFVHYSDPHEPYAPPNLDYPWIDLRLDGRVVGALAANGRSWSFPLEVAPGTNWLRAAARDPGMDSGRWYRLDAVRIEGDGVTIGPSGGWERLEHPGSPPTYQARLPASLELVNRSGGVQKVTLHVNVKQRLDIPEVRVRYGQEVEYADRQIGRLLEAMVERGLLDDTLVVFTSDHGEGLGYHNHVGHIHQVYDTLIKVPLIMTHPGVVSESVRVPDQVSLVDVAPTVAELLGVDGPSPASGRSLVPLLRGEAMAPRSVVAQTFRPEAFTDKRAILADGFKYIHSWSPEREWEELYDLESDPDELHDLVQERPGVASRLRALLEERLAATPSADSEAAELSGADRDRLRALGYLH